MRIPVLLLFCAVMAGCASSSSEFSAAPVGTPPYTTDPNAPQPATGAAPGDSTTAAGTAAQPANSGATYTQQRPVSSEPKPWSSSSSPATTSSPASQSPQTKYPMATRVPGKPGVVRSPYAQYAGDVDVRGIASGTQVRCPYTGKIFIVP